MNENNTAKAAPKTPRARREELARQAVALQGQVARLAADLDAAEVVRNRAVAAASLDGSKAATTARDAATGAVVRAEAELSGARAALAQVEADIAALDTKREADIKAAKLKAGAAGIRAAIALAAKADKAATEFAANYKALVAEVGRLYGTVPAHLKEPVFGGGDLLGKRSIDSTADFLISQSGLTPRPLYAPSEHRQTLAALVAYFGKPVLDEADAVPEPEADWE